MKPEPGNRRRAAASANGPKPRWLNCGPAAPKPRGINHNDTSPDPGRLIPWARREGLDTFTNSAGARHRLQTRQRGRHQQTPIRSIPLGLLIRCLSDPWQRGLRQPGGHSEGPNTRSHPELGRENPQRRWYCVSRRGRAGRRQALAAPNPRRPNPGPQTPRATNPQPAANHSRPLGPMAPVSLRRELVASGARRATHRRPDPSRSASPAIAWLDHRPAPQRHRTTTSPTTAGWSSPVARQAHNLKVGGSNPPPATTDNNAPGFAELEALPFGWSSPSA